MHTQEAGAYHPRTSTVPATTVEALVYRPEAGTVAFPRDQHFHTTTINTNTAPGQLLNSISTAGDNKWLQRILHVVIAAFRNS
jgi:hypothetical protein